MAGLIAGREWVEAAMAHGRPLADVVGGYRCHAGRGRPGCQGASARRRGHGRHPARVAAEIRAALGKRNRKSHLTDAVRHAASVRYPDGIPDALASGDLCGEIRAYLGKHGTVRLNKAGKPIITDGTILEALGRRAPRKSRKR